MSKHWRLKALIPLGFLAIGWTGSGGIGATAHTQAVESTPVAGTTIEETGCNPRDPLSPCFYGLRHGIPVGELLIVEDFF
jgi:hypothetical protein